MSTTPVNLSLSPYYTQSNFDQAFQSESAQAGGALAQNVEALAQALKGKGQQLTREGAKLITSFLDKVFKAQDEIVTPLKKADEVAALKTKVTDELSAFFAIGDLERPGATRSSGGNVSYFSLPTSSDGDRLNIIIKLPYQKEFSTLELDELKADGRIGIAEKDYFLQDDSTVKVSDLDQELQEKLLSMVQNSTQFRSLDLLI